MNNFSFHAAAEKKPKRQRTRALLLDAAVSEFARRGAAMTSVDDIVTRAAVSHGTFYYHFSNKEEILEVVGRTVAAAFVGIIGKQSEMISSGPERVAVATQAFINLASAVPNWGWLVVEALSDMGSFQGKISRGIRRDVLAGVRNREFTIKPSDFLFSGLLALVGSSVRARLENPEDDTIQFEAAEVILRILGVPVETAQILPRKVAEQYGSIWSDIPKAVEESAELILPILLQELETDQPEERPSTDE